MAVKAESSVEYVLAVEPVMVVNLLPIVVESIVVVVTCQLLAVSHQEPMMAASNCRRK